jgi:putative ABC transport system ATP-binding protein
MLQLEGVRKSYRLGDTTSEILHGIDLQVLRGEYTAITGPSGSGKSTLMNILGCLEKPSAGRFYFDARDISALSDDDLTDLRNFRIGFVFQQFNLLPRLTALENVMLPMVYAGYSRPERRERAADMLQLVGLGDRMINRPSQLSGGQQQRVAIARALVNQPELLLADEPTGALDSRTGHDVLDLIERMHSGGALTVLMVTHDPAVAGRCRRILRLQDGRIADDSTLAPDRCRAPAEG